MSTMAPMSAQMNQLVSDCLSSQKIVTASAAIARTQKMTATTRNVVALLLLSAVGFQTPSVLFLTASLARSFAFWLGSACSTLTTFLPLFAFSSAMGALLRVQVGPELSGAAWRPVPCEELG